MELLTCPNCGGFVRRDWDNCRNCGHELSEVVDAGAVVETPAPDITSESSIVDTSVVDEHDSSTADETDAAKAVVESPEESVTTTPDVEESIEVEQPAPEVVDTPADAIDESPAAPEPEPPYEEEPQDAPAVAFAPTPSSSPIADGGSRFKDSGPLLPAKSVIALIAFATLALIGVAGTVAYKVSRDPESTTTTTVVAAPIADEWINYVEPGKRFAVNIPTQPEVRNENVEGLTSLLTLSDTVDKKVRTTTRVTDNSGGWSKEDKVLTDALDRYAAATRQKIETQHVQRVNDRRELSATLKQEDRRSSFKAYVTNKTLVELSVTTNTGQTEPELFTRFADSFVAPAP